MLYELPARSGKQPVSFEKIQILHQSCCCNKEKNESLPGLVQGIRRRDGVGEEADQVVWYSHLFQIFSQFIVIHTVKGFGIVNKAKIDVFLELSGISKWVKSCLWVDGRRENHSSDQEVEMSTGWGGYFILF